MCLNELFRHIYMGDHGPYTMPTDSQHLQFCRMLKGVFSYRDLNKNPWLTQRNAMLSANICIVCLFYDVIKVDSNSISLCWIFSAGNMVRWVSKPKWVRLENEFQFTRIFGTMLVSWFRKIVEQLSQTTIYLWF